jgi:hypothetical protein
LFFAKNKVVTLNSIFSANPKNALFFEIKAALEITDDSSLNNTYSRTASHFSLTLFKNNYFSYLANSSSTTNLIKYLTNAYLLNTDFDATSTSPRSLLFKNQYRPMRKGISNMIRLHATGAMALPIEIRLQVLASSKDVIHS